ncbi:MAG TPA: hypothetical protein VEI97_05890, partial [bacterium]|nr:hypothetical protein [bacterium]
QPGFTGLPAQTFNSAPEFVHAPPGDALCLGEAAAISFAATDPNGDSLTYSLVPALAGHTSQLNNTLSVPNPAPYPLVRYSTGFSAQRPLPGTFHLDPRTGLLTGTPALPGIFQVAVQVEEWYQGRRIGANRREFEIVVVNCPANTPPELTRVSPPGDTVVISGAADRCLTVRVTDPDPGQTLTVRALDGAPVTISPAQVTIQYPPQPVDLTVCWADCSEPGPTLLRLVVGDNGCRSAPADTLLVPVRLAPSANRPPTLRRVPALPDTLVVAAGQELAFEVEAFDPDPDLLVLSLRLAGATGRPAGLTAEPLQGIGLVRTAVRWVPACDASRPGPYVFWVRVSDGGCQ